MTDVANIATLARGYLSPRNDHNGDGAISIVGETQKLSSLEREGIVAIGLSTIRPLALTADLAGNRDGLVTAAEYAAALSRFDVGDPATQAVAGDGLLIGAERDAWYASGLVPQVLPVLSLPAATVTATGQPVMRSMSLSSPMTNSSSTSASPTIE